MPVTDRTRRSGRRRRGAARLPRGAARLPRLAAGALRRHRGRGDDDAARGRGDARPRDRDRAAPAHQDLHATLGRLRSPIRPLHGDAHLNNVLNGPDGPLWNDWEDTSLGPLGWDAACLLAGRDGGERAEAALAASGIELDLPSWSSLRVEARVLQVEIWRAYLSTTYGHRALQGRHRDRVRSRRQRAGDRPGRGWRRRPLRERAAGRRAHRALHGVQLPPARTRRERRHPALRRRAWRSRTSTR